MHPLPRPAQREDEIFDVVDEQDQVIGRDTRREVHARKLLHRATHVLVVNSRGRVFLQKRCLAKDTAPGCWDSSCSGHLDNGEAYRAAAVRELIEEIGVHASPDDLVYHLTLPPCDETGWEFLAIFTLRHDGPVTLCPSEIDAGEWLEPEELTRRLQENPEQFTNPLRMHWPIVRARIASGKY